MNFYLINTICECLLFNSVVKIHIFYTKLNDILDNIKQKLC